MRMIERARVQPHARGPECPGIAYRAREEMLAEALADCAREEPEVGDLDGAVLRHPAQLVPARERAAAPRDVQGDLGLPEVGADLLVGPVPAVAPVVGLADPAVALAIQCGRRPLDRLEDRKSTRLNSSHITISYAVFCLKKKKKKNNILYNKKKKKNKKKNK